MSDDMAVVAPERNPSGIAFTAFAVGAVAANKVRYSVQGYHKPKDEEFEHPAPALERAVSIVDGWEARVGSADIWTGRHVAEIGPGSDLSVGLVLLARGATRYSGLDVNELLGMHDSAHHLDLARHAAETLDPDIDLVAATTAMTNGQDSAMSYVVDPAGRWDRVPDNSVDVVTGNASFEHVPHIVSFCTALTRMGRDGARLISEVDLQTHTAALRDRDPLNIYRIPDRVYDALSFSGIPNRVRPDTWSGALGRAGWADISMDPVTVADPDHVRWVRPHLAPRFRDDTTLGWLAFHLLATLRKGKTTH